MGRAVKLGPLAWTGDLMVNDSDNTPVEDVDARDDTYASFFEEELKQAERVMGRRDVLVGNESVARKYGIELPSLSLQYLFQNNVLFMEHLMMIAGKPASHKSSFAFEIASWTIHQGGFSRLYETEGKYSPGLAENLIGPAVNDRTWQVRVCSTMDQWVELFGRDIETYRSFFKLNKSLKRGEVRPPMLPVCAIIDSLTGRTTAANIKTAHKEGASSNTQGMRTAKTISDWLQIQSFTYMPWYIVMIRHEKEGGIEQSFTYGAKPKKTPGGRAPDFMGGYDIRFAIVKRERKPKWGYNLVQMTMNKNAFGADKLRCATRFSWSWVADPAGGDPVQIPRWDWDLSTAELLAGWDRADLKDIIHVVQGGTVVEPLFNCKQLGLKEVSGADLGLALRQDKALTRLVQDYLNIKRWNLFDSRAGLPGAPNR